LLSPDQPIRVIIGQRKISKDKRIFDEAAETIQLETHDFAEAMATLFERGINQVFVEGGSKIESELIKAGFADEFLIYLAPKLLGGPAVAIGDIGVGSIDKALDLEIIETLKLGNDILVRAVKKES
jgi:diaminohydroxyphosphoribosylaminopyrimidine deaminase/5-amino-6-(5-phosphoribosylamino)uracil reductase